MTRIVSKISSFFTRVFEGCLSDSEIKEYVLREYDHLNNEPHRSSGVRRELFELKTNLAILGWTKMNESLQTDKNKYEEDRRSIVDQWLKELKNSKIINRGIIAKGTGANLDWLDENNLDLDGFKAIALESILKLVEIKRKNIIKAFHQEIARDEKIREGLRISILLSRASRRHEDLRYLNAALKMNDWFFPICRKSRSEKTLVHYLLALTEQERSASEMLK